MVDWAVIDQLRAWRLIYAIAPAIPLHEAAECEIQIIITARQFHYLREGYVALAHIGCSPSVKGERRRGGIGAKASPL